ncbi:hypothetical protein [Streptomyces sp. MUM 16J]|uniref:hypothetical protein n=1 Tax=Streptomyces sp. MUM 16J TaxID=2791988 RepID=UPI001F033CD6|nr:hypothetical protein [Streptomyces sp. MUM 16J]MCH0560008.1 hypothetical protein [Streptomyces sp. MUM 16J]
MADDPFITRLGQGWFLVSPLDAWILLSRHITESDLRKFQEVAESVLTEIDPALSLPASDRWTANISGHVRVHSSVLRNSCASSIAYLATTTAGMELPGGATGEVWARNIVRGILGKANGDSDCAIWRSMHDILPMLAEAAPDVFLDMTEEGLRGDSPLLSSIFTDSEEQGIFGPVPAHTGLLWAIEALTWNSSYFSRAVGVLGRLASLDPGGRWANRPLNSLVSVFHPQIPGKSVNEDRRMRVLDRMLERNPAISWDLMRESLEAPKKSFLSFVHRPQFRDWPQSVVASPGDTYTRFVSDIVGRLVQRAASNPTRWKEIFSAYDSLPADQRELIRQSFAERVEAQSFNEGTDDLWEAIRSLIARHRAYADTDWSLPEEEIAELEQTIEGLTPSRQPNRYAWLFTNGLPDLGNQVRPDNFEEYDRQLTRMRRQAAASLSEDNGLQAVFELAMAVESPWIVGHALANATLGQYDDDLIYLLDEEPNPGRTFSCGFYAQRSNQQGWPWVEELAAGSSLSPRQRGAVLQLSRIYPQSWELAETLGEGVSVEYWQEFSVYGHGQDFRYVEDAARHLLGVRRYAAALTLINLYLRVGDTGDNVPSLVVEAMKHLIAGASDPEVGILSSHELERLLNYLEGCIPDIDAATVLSLEWAFLPAMPVSVSESSRASLLQRSLAEDPFAFTQMIEFSYRPRGREEETSPTVMQVRVAENAYRLLNEWSVVPGLQPEGTLDVEHLSEWMRKARARLQEADRSETGDWHIGRILSHLPEDEDGLWPCAAARDFLEENLNARIESGLKSGLLAQRGMVRRSIGEGGDQERELAQRYNSAAAAQADEWPRLASLLRSLAEHYESLARSEDEEAEFDRRGFIQ